MTVKELIEELSELPDDMLVGSSDEMGWSTTTEAIVVEERLFNSETHRSKFQKVVDLVCY